MPYVVLVLVTILDISAPQRHHHFFSRTLQAAIQRGLESAGMLDCDQQKQQQSHRYTA